MEQLPEALARVMRATGYAVGNQPAPGVVFGGKAQHARRFRTFKPDASWRSSSALSVYFKYIDREVAPQQIAEWRREVWNEGYTPLLWLTGVDHTSLYNGFGRPREGETDKDHLLASFRAIDSELERLDAFAGRVAMDTGTFWSQAPGVTRKTGVDRQLLNDLSIVERRLMAAGVERITAQGLIARAIFSQYLIDRAVIAEEELVRHAGVRSLAEAFGSSQSTHRLFDWLADVFNGDMFPRPAPLDSPAFSALPVLADFLRATDPTTGQPSLFPYQFDIIPVELISAIYEQFANTKTSSTTDADVDIHYTPLTLVSLVLDEVLDGAVGSEHVLDLTCGSGVFLVEALRRLVSAKSGGRPPTRRVIRDVLEHQIYGIDRSEAAIRVAAFSLYLAATELDPEPRLDESVRFSPLVGRSLIIGEAHSAATKSSLRAATDGAKVDVIVGNPPWSFQGQAATTDRFERNETRAGASRTPALDFAFLADEFAHDSTRIGIVLDAKPFFAASASSQDAIRRLFGAFCPVTVINLAATRSWLFPHAKSPAAVLLGRVPGSRSDALTFVNVPWTMEGERTRTFSIAPADVQTTTLRALAAGPSYFVKAQTYGTPRDLLVLRSLREQCQSLATELRSLGTGLLDGLQFGARGKDAPEFLRHLELLDGHAELVPFGNVDRLPLFGGQKLHRARQRKQYESPLLLIREFFVNARPRPLTVVIDRDIAYTEAFFGVSFAGVPDAIELAWLLAGLIGSSLASWFFWLTGAEFGVHKRRLHLTDVESLPVPNLGHAIKTPAGRRVAGTAKRLHLDGADAASLADLDEAVADLYRLSKSDRLVVQDGYERASWEWAPHRAASVRPADADTLRRYADAFMAGIDAILKSRRLRAIEAEMLIPHSNPAIRAIRFVIADGYHKPKISEMRFEEPLVSVLDRIGRRLGVKLGTVFAAERSVVAQSDSEIIVLKSGARRNWLPVHALNDADTVILESLTASGVNK